MNINNKLINFKAEDLLQRKSIKTDTELIKNDLEGKVVLVTGGAGSIGSEIVKLISDFDLKQLVILDQSESGLHELEMYLLLNYPNLNFTIELANIANSNRMKILFSVYDFNIIYHAAAYKHVNIIERNPQEAVYVNILGTVNLADLAVSHGVEKFVLISTDKAVNPTTVMGASKRVAEIYIQSLQNEKSVITSFITTRFGNVLGSRGSVIPHFIKQISHGGPVTVTHKEVTRYFMLISEACQLVLQAGAMGNGGEIYVFDMGEPVRILDLAERMIRLSGLIPYKDIDIVISGLGPGEKLHEELLNNNSTTQPTHHSKIMITRIPSEKLIKITDKINNIIAIANSHDANEIVKLLKDIVPEFKSKNSQYQSLDSNI